MKYTVLVTGDPVASQACESALGFCRAVVDAGHDLTTVFFYAEAVTIANRLNIRPRDEVDLPEAWKDFGDGASVPLQVCIAASGRRGVVNSEMSAAEGLDTENLRAGFEIVGLGQFCEAAIDSDRLVTFA